MPPDPCLRELRGPSLRKDREVLCELEILRERKGLLGFQPSIWPLGVTFEMGSSFKCGMLWVWFLHPGLKAGFQEPQLLS